MKKCNAMPARIKSTQRSLCEIYEQCRSKTIPRCPLLPKREHVRYDDQLEKPPHFLQRGKTKKCINVLLSDHYQGPQIVSLS